MASRSNVAEHLGPVAGLYYFDDFISADEETQIVSLIDSRPFSRVCLYANQL